MKRNEKTYDLQNGYVITCITDSFYFGNVLKKAYYIGIHNDELMASIEGLKVDDLPFWRPVEEFTFLDAKQANEQFLRSKAYYSNK